MFELAVGFPLDPVNAQIQKFAKIPQEKVREQRIPTQKATSYTRTPVLIIFLARPPPWNGARPDAWSAFDLCGAAPAMFRNI